MYTHFSDENYLSDTSLVVRNIRRKNMLTDPCSATNMLTDLYYAFNSLR